MGRHGASKKHGRPAAAVSAPAAAAPAHFTFDEPPRKWVEHYLAARVGDFRLSAEAIRRFLGCYDRTPTLAKLGAGSSRDRHLFVLAVAVLADELLDASLARIEQTLKRLDAEERRTLAIRSRAVARLRAVVEDEAAALGPVATGALGDALRVATTVVPPASTIQSPPVPYRLLYALDFILGHVRGLGIMARRRLVAVLVREWTGKALTEDHVRLNVKRRRETAQKHRPECAASPVAALYVPTHAACLVGELGALCPLGAHEACGIYHPAVAARVCLPLAVPPATAVAVRSYVVGLFYRLKLPVLLTTSARS